MPAIDLSQPRDRRAEFGLPTVHDFAKVFGDHVSAMLAQMAMDDAAAAASRCFERAEQLIDQGNMTRAAYETFYGQRIGGVAA